MLGRHPARIAQWTHFLRTFVMFGGLNDEKTELAPTNDILKLRLGAWGALRLKRRLED